MTAQAFRDSKSREDLDAALAKHPAVGSFPRRNIYGRIGVNPDRLTLRGLPMEARVWAKSILRHDNPRPFLIYGRPRSGTTLLVRLLDQVPGVRCDGELLRNVLISPFGFLRRLPRRAGPDIQAYGMKLISYHLMDVHKIHRPLAFFDRIAHHDYRIIHLKRNTWDQTLSLLKAHKSSVYDSRSFDGSQSLQLDPERFLELLKWNESMLDYENAVMSHVEHFTVCYDRDLKEAAQHQTTIDALSAYLGVPSAQVESRMRRTGGKDGLQQVQNMNELVARVRDSDMAHLIP